VNVPEPILPLPSPNHLPRQQPRQQPRAQAPRWTPVALAACHLACGLWWGVQGAHAAEAAASTGQASTGQAGTTGQRAPAKVASGTWPFSLSFPPALTGATEPHNGQEPLFFSADVLDGEADVRTRAKGNVRLRQGNLRVQADELTHTMANNTATAEGHVLITKNGNAFWGPKLTIQLDALTGEFIKPHFWLASTKAGGEAERVEFMGENRLRAQHTSYSSCRPEDLPDGTPGEPDWSLKTSDIDLDFERNEGRARNAVIWFKGVPILAAPTLTFPLNEARKSGWLPPSFDYDTKSGFELTAPYYWNIAPNRDMTIAPMLSTRRGAGLDTEYRYLSRLDEGSVHVFGIPDDRVAKQGRSLVDFRHKGQFEEGNSLARNGYDLRWRHVSDDDYWKDFPHNLPTLTPRLYESHAGFERQLNARKWGLGDSQTTLYASVQRWQTLRDLSPATATEAALSAVEAPYRREPQMGVRSRSGHETGTVWAAQAEFNRFAHSDPTKPTGNRLHATGQVSRTFNVGGLQMSPRLSMQATSYDMDQALTNGQRGATRALPTLSLDSGMAFERPVSLFDKSLTQTLEPRLQYVRTPYRDQSMLPLFDSATRDFNHYAIYSENAFTGADRVNDANQITLGVTSRLIDQLDGTEALRLGVVQKLLLADQRINPDGDGPITQRLSDLLLLGSTNVLKHWTLDSFLQFNAQNHATSRGLMSARYSPGSWRTLYFGYNYTRGSTGQLELGWQWPLAGVMPSLTGFQRNEPQASVPGMSAPVAAAAPSAVAQAISQATGNSVSGCGGTWYGVGRLNYNTRDRLMTTSLVGVEYDAGCWIGRVVAERISTGRTQASTRIMFQLELSGLSRISLGSNPLRSLRENIPGYRMLRDERTTASPADASTGPAPYSDSDD
jgi:LPS-assembly protein